MVTLEELRSNFFNDSVVLQPTTLCNLNCRYCYLPERKHQYFMSPEVTSALADDFEGRDRPVTVLWHGGEPLAIGTKWMRSLLDPFESLRHRNRVKHTLQTNGTLISDEWICLLKDYSFSLGVSIDGPSECNSSRVSWSGQPAFSKTMAGIALLREAGIRFGVIVVVSDLNVLRAKQIYSFISSLGCSSIGINIEEAEGLNRENGIQGEVVSRFWDELLEAWIENPVVEVREFRQALGWAKSVLRESSAALGSRRRELYPTISWKGDVVLLSPEFIGAAGSELEKFVVGNVVETPLRVICDRAIREAGYVSEFLAGIQKCEASCRYFSYCRGGTASNKYFETGSVAATETHFCKNHKQRVIDAVIDRAKKGGPADERAWRAGTG